MAIEDLFHLDEVEDAQRISRYSDQDLMKQDVVEFRQIQAGAWSIGAGIGRAWFSFGATLAVSGYGGRRINVAVRKLELIHAELLSLGLQPHDPTKRGYLIPVAVGVAGCGVDTGVVHLVNPGVNGVGAAALAHAHHLIPLDPSGALGQYAGQAGAEVVEQSLAGQVAGTAVDGTLTQSMANRATKCAS
ncbi:MAG: hypothetical protein M1830_007133 [Pleopsidium flavum]|nr:MAG: hypothetical protein M1830_007133 [Pleopsidium flavum]